ncbi:unnamed protein product [Linum trigynum]|uniref:No apical meristem-associated C-terminal domain-containing protein n=1 Tax=Linum trigynum TaxID=586398 RepID=A0AAV2CMM8_9ROSI
MSSKRGPNWKVHEDVNLCKSWISISEDGAVGINQKSTRLWERVEREFRRSDPTTIRTTDSMESRLRLISNKCKVWKGALQRVERSQTSGTNQVDVEFVARSIYKEENGDKAFEHEHCWVILRNCPKWYCDPQLVVGPIPPMGQGSQSSPIGIGSQSSPVEGLDDIPDEGATPFVLSSHLDNSSIPNAYSQLIQSFQESHVLRLY